MHPEPALSVEQLQAVVGTVLGDSVLDVALLQRGNKVQAKTASVQGGHSSASALAEFKCRQIPQAFTLTHVREGRETTINGRTGKSGDFQRFGSKSLVQIARLLPLLYDESGTRRMRPEALEYAGAVGLAWLIMDDGCVQRFRSIQDNCDGIVISTQGFTEEDNEAAANWLRTWIGHTAPRTRVDGVSVGADRVIRISPVAARILAHRVAPYIPDFMRYKLPRGQKYAPFQGVNQTPEGPVWVRVTKIATEHIEKSKRYCVTVDAPVPAFFTIAGLVHNCGPGDCAVNAKIYDPLVESATKQGYFRPLRDEIKPKGWPSHVPWTLQGVDQHRMSMCRHMKRAGLYVDQTRRFEHSVKLEAEGIKHFAEARKYAASIGLQGPVKSKARGPEPFNPGSDKQLAHVLYEVWGLIPTKFSDKTDAPSVDDEVIREIITSENLPKERFVFLDAVRRGKRAKKAKATFVDPLERVDLWTPIYSKRGKVLNREPLCQADGRIHPFVSSIITSVSRLNSSAINEHNMPGIYRDQIAAQPIYHPDDPRYPGRVLIGGDVDQFHLRIIANRWRVGRLLEAFRDGIDPHSSLALDFFGAKFKHADGWGPDGMSLKRKPKKDSAADKMRNMAKILRYRGAYADTEEGLLQSVKKVEDPNTGDLPFAHMSLREVKKLYRIWMKAEPEWEVAWQWVMDQYQVNGGWLEECIMGRRSGGLENGKKQAVVNYDILGAEPPIMALVEADLRAEFPDDFEGHGTGLIVQVHDSANLEMEGFAWTEIKDGKKVVVCDERTEKRRRIVEECMNRTLPGWEIPITASAQVGPVRDEKGNIKLSNWREA